MNQIKSGQIMADNKKPIKCCQHKNLIPLEVGFAQVTYPNGYKAPPNYNFAINVIGANRARIKSYLCLDCKCEIKAPNPDTVKKDKL